MALVRCLEIAPVGAVADERLVAAAQVFAQGAQDALTHLGVTLGLVQVAANHVAALLNPHVLGFQLGVAALAGDE